MANKKRNGTFPGSNFRFKCAVPLFGCKYSELSNLKLQNTVAFIHYDDIYYRMYPVSIDMGVALQREVKILRDAKQGAYGTTSQTSSIKSSSTMYVDGVAYSLQEGKECPHEVTETICLYKGDTVFQLTKKNLRKMFPKKKEEIDAWFKAGNTLPKTIPDALSLLRYFRGE